MLQIIAKPTLLTCSNELVYYEQTKAGDIMRNLPECHNVMRGDTIHVIDHGVESDFYSRN